jgi:hypothetical protein
MERDRTRETTVTPEAIRASSDGKNGALLQIALPGRSADIGTGRVE